MADSGSSSIRQCMDGIEREIYNLRKVREHASSGELRGLFLWLELTFNKVVMAVRELDNRVRELEAGTRPAPQPGFPRPPLGL